MGKANRPMMLSLLSLWFAGCLATSAPPNTPEPIHPAFLAGDTVLAQAQLDSLSMEERIAQLMMVPLYSKPGEPESAASVAALITDLGVGGVIAMQGDKANTPATCIIWTAWPARKVAPVCSPQWMRRLGYAVARRHPVPQSHGPRCH